MSSQNSFNPYRPTKMIVFYSDGGKAIFPDVHVSAIINSISNEGVLTVQFFRSETLCVEFTDRHSALKYARTIGENHSYDKVIIFRKFKD